MRGWIGLRQARVRRVEHGIVPEGATLKG
jgi:hypothetical protein